MQVTVSLALAAFALHKYAKSPENLTTSLFSGGLRIMLWFIGISAQVAILAPSGPDSLQASAHSLHQWAGACELARPWAGHPTANLNGTLYTRDADTDSAGAGGMAVLSAITGSSSLASLPSVACAAGGGDPSSPDNAGNLVMVALGAFLLLASALTLGLTKPAANAARGVWCSVLLLLPAAAYVRLLPALLQLHAELVGLRPQHEGVCDANSPAGTTKAAAPFIFPLVLHILAGSVGFVAFMAWRQWRGAATAALRGATVRGFLSNGYRIQMTPVQARSLVAHVGGDKSSAIAEAAVSEAEKAQAACWGFAWLLPTHTFLAMQTTLVAVVACVTWLTTDTTLRLCMVGGVVLGSLLLVRWRRPWCLEELTDLDVMAHSGILLQVILVGANSLHPPAGVRGVTDTFLYISQGVILLAILLVVVRGYSSAARSVLARIGARIRALLPELGSADSAGDSTVGQIVDSRVPTLVDIASALAQRLARCGRIQPAVPHTIVSLSSVLSFPGGMVRQGGLGTPRSDADAVLQALGPRGAALVSVASTQSSARANAETTDTIEEESSARPTQPYSLLALQEASLLPITEAGARNAINPLRAGKAEPTPARSDEAAGAGKQAPTPSQSEQAKQTPDLPASRTRAHGQLADLPTSTARRSSQAGFADLSQSMIDALGAHAATGSDSLRSTLSGSLMFGREGEEVENPLRRTRRLSMGHMAAIADMAEQQRNRRGSSSARRSFDSRGRISFTSSARRRSSSAQRRNSAAKPPPS